MLETNPGAFIARQLLEKAASELGSQSSTDTVNPGGPETQVHQTELSRISKRIEEQRAVIDALKQRSREYRVYIEQTLTADRAFTDVEAGLVHSLESEVDRLVSLARENNWLDELGLTAEQIAKLKAGDDEAWVHMDNASSDLLGRRQTKLQTEKQQLTDQFKTDPALGLAVDASHQRNRLALMVRKARQRVAGVVRDQAEKARQIRAGQSHPSANSSTDRAVSAVDTELRALVSEQPVGVSADLLVNELTAELDKSEQALVAVEQRHSRVATQAARVTEAAELSRAFDRRVIPVEQTATAIGDELTEAAGQELARKFGGTLRVAKQTTDAISFQQLEAAESGVKFGEQRATLTRIITQVKTTLIPVQAELDKIIVNGTQSERVNPGKTREQVLAELPQSAKSLFDTLDAVNAELRTKQQKIETIAAQRTELFADVSLATTIFELAEKIKPHKDQLIALAAKTGRRTYQNPVVQITESLIPKLLETGDQWRTAVRKPTDPPGFDPLNLHPTFLKEKLTPLIDSYLATERDKRKGLVNELDSRQFANPEALSAYLRQIGWYKVDAATGMTGFILASKVEDLFRTLTFCEKLDSAQQLLVAANFPNVKEARVAVAKLIEADPAWRALGKIYSGKVSTLDELKMMLQTVNSRHLHPRTNRTAGWMAAQIDDLMLHWTDPGIGYVEKTGLAGIAGGLKLGAKYRKRNEQEIATLLAERGLDDPEYGIDRMAKKMFVQFSQSQVDQPVLRRSPLPEEDGRQLSPPLLTVERPSTVPAEFDIMGQYAQAEVKIGRLNNNNFIINHEGISREHAKIVRERGRYLVADLGSTHGTFVNGSKVDVGMNRVINSGDYLQFGPNAPRYYVQIEQNQVTIWGQKKLDLHLPTTGAPPPQPHA